MPRTLGPADNGAQVTLGVGAQLRIALPESPTTGFRWRLDDAAAQAACGLLTLMDDAYAGPAPGLAGGAGQRVWTWQAMAPGQVQLQWVLRRAGAPAAEQGRFSAQVKVQGSAVASVST
ncbi:protease inhibitor I42 family protein [Ideonella sp. B508-1]|uniref:protease inhibitor I42 family protein n=1 Tax=Ideonella sp. B508-1 TaxID=137716 RepID=UPI00131ED34C|nr:protease inhibitor I42 family protein [Ideonella sp. B508-1]